jgi:hypothetical protein
MTSGQQLIDETRGHLLAGMQEQRNRLLAPYTAGQTTLSFAYPIAGTNTSSITPGKVIEVGTTLFYVWATNQTANTATVQGGWDSTVDANQPVNATVTVSPRFPQARIVQALNEELSVLCAPTNGLFQMATLEFPYIAVVAGYDLPTAPNLILEVYDVRYDIPGPSKKWPRIERVNWRYESGAETSSFPSGQSLTLSAGGYPGFNVRVFYKAAFNPALTNLTADAAAATGMAATMLDIPPLGAAIRLMAGREIKRNFIEGQPDTRRSTEVPPGAIMRADTGLAMLRQQRIAEEKSRLQQLWPVKRV